jgi:hypothetical protein
MKRLVLSLSLIAALAVILTTGNHEINFHRQSAIQVADGGNPPPPPWPPKSSKPRIVPPVA